MEQYAAVIGTDAAREDYLQIAAYFQKTVDHFRAGEFFHRAGEYAKVGCFQSYVPLPLVCLHAFMKPDVTFPSDCITVLCHVITCQALDHFIQCPLSKYPDGEHIDMAIKTVS